MGGHTFPQLYLCCSYISTAVLMLLIHFYSCTYVAHTFLQLYLCCSYISAAVLMLLIHFHSCTYVAHTFLQLYLCCSYISTAVLMLDTYFHSCAYVGHTIPETSSKTTSELDTSTNVMSGYLLQRYACLRYTRIVHNVKA